MFAGVIRFGGLAIALVALMRETWLLRAPGTLPLARLVQRELHAKPRTGQLLLCTIAGLALVAAPVGWSIALGNASLTADLPQQQLAPALALAGTVVIKALWVFFEELAFRAALITMLARRVAIPVAVSLAAIAFAAAHGRDAVSGAVLIADGIGFGVAYVATRSLYAPIAWHFAKNLAVWILTGQSTLQFGSMPWRLAGTAPSGVVELSFAILIVGLTSIALTRWIWMAPPSGRASEAHAAP